MKKSDVQWIEDRISNAHTTASKALTAALKAERNSSFVVNIDHFRRDRWGFPRFEERSVTSVLQMVLDHLGLKIKFHDEVNSHITLEPKK